VANTTILIKKGSSVIQSVYQYQEAFDFSMMLHLLFQMISLGISIVTGKLIIPATYEDAFDFSEGLAAVQVDGAYGFIDV